MVFTTHIFLFYFLPLFLLVYFGLPRRWRNLWITLASYVFYGWWEPWFVCLMMFTTVMDFIWGKVITRPGATRGSSEAGRRGLRRDEPRASSGSSSTTCLPPRRSTSCWQLVGAERFHVMTVVLPIGISFYTFHSLTYIIDLYRGHATPARSFTDFSAFVALFPDLVAGPIIRYKTLAAQLASREHTLDAVRVRRRHLHAGVCQEDPAGQSGRQRGGRRVQCGGPWRAATPGSACWPMPSRSTSISAATRTWPWGWGGCWASSS